jgi:hypothetical protein
VRITAHVDTIDAIRELDQVILGLRREVTQALLAAGQPILTAARAITPLGPGVDGEGGDHKLEHIRDTLKLEARGRVLRLVSNHPGSAVLNYGGTITPHGVQIHFPQRLMGQRAGEQQLPALEADLERRLDALFTRHGL